MKKLQFNYKLAIIIITDLMLFTLIAVLSVLLYLKSGTLVPENPGIISRQLVEYQMGKPETTWEVHYSKGQSYLYRNLSVKRKISSTDCRQLILFRPERMNVNPDFSRNLVGNQTPCSISQAQQYVKALMEDQYILTYKETSPDFCCCYLEKDGTYYAAVYDFNTKELTVTKLDKLPDFTNWKEGIL